MILDPPRPEGKGLPDKPQRKPGSEPVVTVMRPTSGPTEFQDAARRCLHALTDSQQAFSSTVERKTATTTGDWQRWTAPGVTFTPEAGGGDSRDFSEVHQVAISADSWLCRSRTGPPGGYPALFDFR